MERRIGIRSSMRCPAWRGLTTAWERESATRNPMIGERISPLGLCPFAIHGLAGSKPALPAARLPLTCRACPAGVKSRDINQRRDRGFATRKPMIGERTSLSGLFPFAIHGLASRRLAFPAARLRHLSVITAPPFWIRADRARSALPMGNDTRRAIHGCDKIVPFSLWHG